MGKVQTEETRKLLPSNGISVLLLPTRCSFAAASKSMGKVLIGEGDDGCRRVGSGGSYDEHMKVGEVGGVLWAIRAQLSGVSEEVSLLMNKVDLGLSMVMGLGSESFEKPMPTRKDALVRAEGNAEMDGLGLSKRGPMSLEHVGAHELFVLTLYGGLKLFLGPVSPLSWA